MWVLSKDLIYSILREFKAELFFANHLHLLSMMSPKRLVYDHSTQLGKGELACVTDFSTVTKLLCFWLTLVGFGGPYLCRFPEKGHLHLQFCCSF